MKGPTVDRAEKTEPLIDEVRATRRLRTNILEDIKGRFAMTQPTDWYSKSHPREHYGAFANNPLDRSGAGAKDTVPLKI